MGKTYTNHISSLISSFKLLSLGELTVTFHKLQSFESYTISKEEFLMNIQLLFDDIEQQTKAHYKFYHSIEDKGMLDANTIAKLIRFDYISNHCETITILFAAYFDSSTGTIKDLQQYYDYRVYH